MKRDPLPHECERFILANPHIDQNLQLELPTEGRAYEFAKACGHVGWYRRPFITVFPDLCTKPGTGYSFPCHISDRTFLGVMAHELGHHAHFTRPDVEEIRKLFPKKGRVTGYEPNIDESFAETFRLFVLNPDLLEKGRPQRYWILRDLGFRPSEDRPWQEVLRAAPTHMKRRIEPWITRGDKA